MCLTASPELVLALLNTVWFCAFAIEVELIVGDESDELLGSRDRHAMELVVLRLSMLRKKMGKMD